MKQRATKYVEAMSHLRAAGRALVRANIGEAFARSFSAVSIGAGFYNSTKAGREILGGWRPRLATSNQTLANDLSAITAQLRELDRVAPTMRGIIEGRKAELVGTGIWPRSAVKDRELAKKIDAKFDQWAKTAGFLGESLLDLQRMASGEYDVSGNIIWKVVIDPSLLKRGQLPFRIQVFEKEDMSDVPCDSLGVGNKYVSGVEADAYNRAVRYHLRDPENLSDRGFTVDAEYIMHAFERRRAKMVIGEPRLSSLVERTMQDDEIIVLELKTARSTSGTSAWVASTELYEAVNADATASGGAPMLPTEVSPAGISYLPDGAQVSQTENKRPSAAVKDFRATTRGDQAAAACISRVWIDRDGAAYNFANSRFDQIRTRMMVRPAHVWFGAAVASWPYEQVLPWILLSLGIDMPKDPEAREELFAHNLEPDVPPAMDEKADAEAFKTQNEQGINSRTQWMNERGMDPEKIANERQREKIDDATRAIALRVELQGMVDAANKSNPDLALTVDDVLAMITTGDAKTVPAPAAAAPADKSADDAGDDKPTPAAPAAKGK